MMNVLIVGNAAREHAIAEAIVNSPQQPKLFSYMKARNPGIVKLSEDIQIGDYSNLDEIKAFAESNNIEWAFVGPEAPLSEGVVDALKEVNIPAVGPTKSLARLETSKSFTRLLTEKYNVPVVLSEIGVNGQCDGNGPVPEDRAKYVSVVYDTLIPANIGITWWAIESPPNSPYQRVSGNCYRNIDKKLIPDEALFKALNLI